MNKEFNLALIGLGQIGNYLLNELNKNKKDILLKTGKKINIVAISAKNIKKKRKYKINKKIFYKNPLEIFKKKKLDLLIECIGMSDGVSKKVVEIALKNKIHVVTPNKALIAKHGDYLAKLAEKNKVNLEFEASVGGGIPIIRTIKEGLATNKINKVFGILNGTCNYILSEMKVLKKILELFLKKHKLLVMLNLAILNLI
jgi:homoserine dehydrogenase